MRLSWKGDISAGAVLLLTGIIITWPILGGGYLAYMDNPAHLAEITSLAHDRGGGWSDIAFCGYSLGSLHSPAWYGILAFLSRLGVPIGAIYAFLLYLAFMAVPLAVYKLSRRWLNPLPAAVPAYLIMIQGPAVVGVGSAAGGMWTFYLASGALLFLIDLLAGMGVHREADEPQQADRGRDQETQRGPLKKLLKKWNIGLSAWLAVIALTHLYLAVPVAIVIIFHFLYQGVAGRRDVREMIRCSGAVLLGLAAAGVYWLPVLLSGKGSDFVPQNLSFTEALAHLLVPTDVIGLLGFGRAFPGTLFYTDAVPMLLLISGGITGIVWLLRGKIASPGLKALAIYGAVLAVVMFLLVAVIAPLGGVTFLGPNSWRLLYFTRLGLALACIPVIAAVVADFRGRHEKKRVGERSKIAAVILAAAALGSGFFWRIPLVHEVPAVSSGDMAEVKTLWQWLEKNHGSDWGRVYLQDTFYTPPLDSTLKLSHILVRTAAETGIQQLGAMYGIAPFPTSRWTNGEFGTLFALNIRESGAIPALVERMEFANCTHLVTADPSLLPILKGSYMFEQLFEVGRFAVLRRAGSSPQLVEPGEGVTAVVETNRVGAYTIEAVSNHGGGALLIKESYHPFWQLEGRGGVYLEAHPSGLMMVKNLGQGENHLKLTYRSPIYPLWISLFAWLAIINIFILKKRIKK